MIVKKSTKITLLIGGILVVLLGVIGITYAFFATSGSQEQANTFYTSGCLNITLTDASAAIDSNHAYPITDIAGLEETSYDFTIENTCSTSTNYQINLESLNQVANLLDADYIKVALSSDTVDNIISILSSNTPITPSVSGAYEAYNLYTGTIAGNETKTYHLRLWIDYDATIEQAANKVYESKINVIANPEIQVTDTLEAMFALNEDTLTSTLTSNVTSASYCTSTDNICTPTTNASIANNSYSVTLEGNDNKQMVCTRLNGTSKVICSNPVEIAKIILASEFIESLYEDNQDILAYDGTEDNNLRYIGDDPANYAYFNCSNYSNPTSDTCELWRIIGIFNENTHGVSGQKLVKLIRNESIGDFSWDNKTSGVGSSTSSSGSNDWSDSRLMMLLNPGYEEPNGNIYAYEGSLYYNARSGTCYSGSNGATISCDFTSTGLKNDTTRNMIETVTWKLGGTANYTSASNGLASHFYGYERGTTVYSGNPTEWEVKIGLMYPSDYGYATSGGNTTDRETCLAKELYNWDSLSDCYNNDWLYTGSIQWTFTPRSSNSRSVFGVNAIGSLGSYSAVYGYDVRPSIYLKSNIAISGGSGTESDPYVLSV